MICCCTGHRPKKFPWDYGSDEQKQNCYRQALYDRIQRYITEKHVSIFLSGMALGADMDFAECVLLLRKKYPFIRLHCILPCRTQTRYWEKAEIDRYRSILQNADQTKLLSEKYTHHCMSDRNCYMVDKSDYVFAIWNGQTKGGTWHTLQYAKIKHKQIEILFLDTLS